ncbi:MAG: serine/threonine protein kinase [Deltaproteobacteria bacterium]|nr:serine/threonine protein kinase [Deltaproteobacteria bacterium]
MRSGDQGDTFGAGDTAVAHKQTETSSDDAGRVAEPTQELIGSTLSGRYMVTRKIGQGGMGAVYEAKHTAIGGRFAVKVLLDKYAKRDAIVARLKQEAQLATSLDHEHIIRVTDFGSTDDGRTFVVMEFLEGESFAELLARESKLPEQRILRIASQAASALAAAHAKGIVHRDIKPENLFIIKRKEQDFVKIVDFGISKNLRASDEQEDQPRLTQTGMVLGTPLYMSPEQARGDEDLDHRVDIYALGVIMYEAATGRVPFAGTNYLSVISQVLNDEPKPVRELRPELTDEFEAIVAKAMEKNRNERYASATALLEDLNALLDDPTHSTERAKITGPRRRIPRPKIPKLAWAVGGIGILVAAVTIFVVMMNGGPPKKKQQAQVMPPVVVDAAVAPPPAIDAAPEPTLKTLKIHIVTEPPGGDVFKESEPLGKAPQDLVLVKKDKDVKISATLAGGYYGDVTINPVEESGDTKTLTLRLRKQASTVYIKAPKQGSGAGSAAPTSNQGELGPNPYKHGK